MTNKRHKINLETKISSPEKKKYSQTPIILVVDRDSSVGIATRYGLNGPGIESQWQDEIFRNRPERPWGPLSLLCNGYRENFQGVKWPGSGVDRPPHLTTRLKEE